jgi:hypothetical protein
MQFREAQANEIIDKIEDLFSWSGQAGIVRTFVECIQNEINGALNRERDHLREALCQSLVTGSSCALVVCQIYAREYAATEIGLSA